MPSTFETGALSEVLTLDETGIWRAPHSAPVSFPVDWDDLDDVAPADFTIRTARQRLGHGDRWAAQMSARQHLSTDLIDEGRAIPVARVQAMHEGKRRARARRN